MQKIPVKKIITPEILKIILPVHNAINHDPALFCAAVRSNRHVKFENS